ncbi:sulfotransferase family protein [Chelativorans intermedius]|uniref:Sulfotransferase family protein n=1 Tax=Chelativorans intermedius TaxID=515947 RepID=A0ABV6D349_9HYPH|nr:sulfotransferase family protein [Chelativorans intermedius]MCT8998437.1 sulfotransferase family protein [Chelativorans intermedius]
MNSYTLPTPKQVRRIAREHLQQFTPARRDYTDPWCLVFPESKIVYLPIPKAANSSIRAELLRIININPEEIEKVDEFSGFDKRKFSNLSKIIDKEWFVFSVIRNPFSRLASAYLDKLKTRSDPFPALRRMGLRRDDSFLRFLRVIRLWPQETLNDHFMPQSLLLKDALKNPHIKIYKMENLRSIWGEVQWEVAQRTGINLQELGHRNRSKSELKWKDLYSEKSYHLVRRIYKDDFEMFGYDKNID